MRRRICTCCPAKLNLALAVDAPGVDGLHPISSWMVTVDFSDDLAVTMLEPGDLSRYAVLWHENAPQQAEIDWSIRDDLAVRAHLALESHVGRSLPLEMKLQKRIPVGGGLGGGSSNAAAMLRAVDQLYGLDLDDAVLLAIATTLGSDVPFLLRGGSALVKGTGESVEQLPGMPEFHAVLVMPPLSCPTGLVYAAFDAGASIPFEAEAVQALVSATPDPGAFFNDLAAPAMSVTPDLAAVLAKLEALAGGSVHLSGSGSTLFVPCPDSTHAEALASTVHAQLDLPAIAVAASAIDAGILETIQ